MKKSLIVFGLSAMLVFPSVTLTSTHAAEKSGRQVSSAQNRQARRSHPKMQLNRLWRGIGRLESSSSALTKQQAQRIVALVRPWSSRPQMSDGQAQSLHNQISAVLTTSQKSALQKMAQDRRQNAGSKQGAGREGANRGPNAGGTGRRAGARGKRQGAGVDRQRMQQMRGFLQNVNPFYAPTGYKEFKYMPERMQQGLVRRYQHARTILVTLSKKAG